LHHAVRAIGLDRVNALVAGGGRRVHLAAADDFTVGGGQIEVGRTVLGRQTAVAGIIRGVLAHRLDTLLGRGLGRVPLAGQNHLVIAGPEVEHELFATALEDVIAAHECVSRGWVLGLPGGRGPRPSWPEHYIPSGISHASLRERLSKFDISSDSNRHAPASGYRNSRRIQSPCRLTASARSASAAN